MIGVAFNALGAILVGVFIGATGDFIAEDIRNDPEFTAEEADIVSNLFGGIGWYYVIVSAIAAILGVVALVLLRRNNKSTVSGVIFIVTAVLSALLTIFVATVPAILYLVAGILAIVRKPIDTNDNTIESY
ncbi:hypothetical protein CHI12_07790 [Terribacillus saccharophilus]|uniref:DUF4064 domain-containing protein n=1 Tax=Terribacillus saccharophilus TaxID=361277 RepID=A0A268HE82_9BACI|nr:hypothetical protein CHI12_07790 [Terribacillus saccharophilus]